MRSYTTESLTRSPNNHVLSRIIRQMLVILSLLLVFGIFWGLKLTGITMAGEAFCGKDEHVHSEECSVNTASCLLEAHIHDESCYSDITADQETADDWERSLAGVVRSGIVSENVIAVARSQLDYRESTLNFQVDANGIRRGITRYGQWYGNPYGDWSAMFVSFCLHYGGVEDIPANAGPEAMRLEWEEAGLYKSADETQPQAGNILFLHKTDDSSVAAEMESSFAAERGANAVAVITGVEGDTVTVIEGNLDNAVAEITYSVHDLALIGYGLVPSPDEPIIVLPILPDSAKAIAKMIDYTESMFIDTNCFVVYTVSGEDYYAFDGTGNAIQIYIDDEGNILSDTDDPDSLLWTFSGSNSSYTIQNLSSGRYMHAYPNNGSGVTTSGAYPSTLIEVDGGVKVRSNSEYARLDVNAGKFIMTQNANEAAVYQFGVVSRCTVWLDGTCGGLMSLGGSPDRSYTVATGDVLQLPSEWISPEKYSYTLRGWYDVVNSTWYAAGAEVTVTGNMVFYADWVASTYDIGQYDARTSDTVSTSAFVTTHVFDYNSLFNVMSGNATVNVTAAGHSENWSVVASGGKVNYQGMDSLDLLFVDYDSTGDISYPRNNNPRNTSGGVYSGLYSKTLGQILFDPDTQVIGKTYLGTGDHLFQYMTDPDDAYYGYYYYDSHRNAASYNQTDRRFYVYDYLEATSDSVNTSSPSDFLPFNSPYANTNGKDIRTYTYDGIDGEYVGVNHIRYDAKYNTYDNKTDYVTTNYGFGMQMDVEFYLPNAPGQTDADGHYGNKDINGNDMHFHFSGDDDLWVLIDGVLVLDVGGIHGEKEGDIDFSSGTITVAGSVTGNLTALGVGSGEHVMTVLYLERGSSQSNCAIYFNLAPRFSLTIQKEDVLTRDLLNGAEFSVYVDGECTVPAQLWVSEDSYDQGDPATNVFTVRDGIATMWGLSSGNTYYIKETKAPDAAGYSCANGTIRLVIDKDGIATYHVEIIEDADGTAPSNGFTVHGIRIDEETQEMHIVATNAPDSVMETTTVQVYKKWEDNIDHSADLITVYLTVTDPDGTIRRIREVLLSEENDWKYTWTNLPKYDYENLRLIQYGIEESYESGYYSTVRQIAEITTETVTWAEAYTFVDGQTYILKTTSGCLATTAQRSDTLAWMETETAKSSPLALWTATVSGGKVTLTNGAGQTLSFNNGWTHSSRYFYVTTSQTNYQKLTAEGTASGIRFYCTYNNRNYYLTTLNSAGRFGSSTMASNATIFNPMTKVTETDVVPVEDWAYQITNTPLDADNETSLTVQKLWDSGGVSVDYQRAQVTVRLLANGVVTGRTVTLSLKNGWQDTFRGLPYTDADGNVITYTVEESWNSADWTASYGPVVTVDGDPPTYTTTVTNTYHHGVELPSTGSAARLLYILCGSGIMLASLVWGCVLRCKRERRVKEIF